MNTETGRTKPERRKEYRGHGRIVQSGHGSAGKDCKRIVFVEREPDNLLAAAILVYAMQGEFLLLFTDRHSINYDITGHKNDLEWADEILILCPSVNEYSIYYLQRQGKPFIYYGSTTKLKECFPELYQGTDRKREFDYDSAVILSERSVAKKVAEYFEIHQAYVEDVALYTERLIPKDMDLYNIMRYQYLHFSHDAKEHWQLFFDALCNNSETILVSEDEEQKMRQIYDKEVIFSKSKMETAKILEHDGHKFAFLQGGCPCTLILNLALRELDCDISVNVCTHRQHFTVLSEDMNAGLYHKYISGFLYSGGGLYSAGGCFGADYTFEEFVEAFLSHKRIHGFYKERSYGYDSFEPSDHEWIKYDGNQQFLYRNFNFTIFIDAYCNADCKFCIEQIKTENTGRIEKCAGIVGTEEYLQRLEEVLKKIRPYNPSVSVTGGEPLLSPYFPGVMKLLKKYQFRKTVITTNGTDILNHMDEIVEGGISHVNFSRPHYKEEVVRSIMRFRNDMASFGDLEKAVRMLESRNVRTRFNCIISKEGISTVEGMKRYMDFIRSFGCKHVVFREMMSFNEVTSKNEEKKRYASENRVYMDKLWEEIDRDSDFEPYSNVRGHYYYIEMYRYKDMVMVSERANLKCLEDKRRENRLYIYEMIFHPNGNLCAGWNEMEDVLDYYC